MKTSKLITGLFFLAILIVAGCSSIAQNLKKDYSDKSVVYFDESDQKVNLNPLYEELDHGGNRCMNEVKDSTNIIHCGSSADEQIKAISHITGAISNQEDKIWSVDEPARLNPFVSEIKQVRSLENENQLVKAIDALEKIDKIKETDYYSAYLAELKKKYNQPAENLKNGFLMLLGQKNITASPNEDFLTEMKHALTIRPDLKENEEMKSYAEQVKEMYSKNMNCSIAITEPAGAVFVSTGFDMPLSLKLRCDKYLPIFQLTLTAEDYLRFNGYEKAYTMPLALDQSSLQAASEFEINQINRDRQKNKITMKETGSEIVNSILTEYNLSVQSQVNLQPAEYAVQKTPEFFSARYQQAAGNARPGSVWQTLSGEKSRASLTSAAQFTMGANIDNQEYDLMYGHPNNEYAEGIWSSYISVKVDDSVYKLNELSNIKNDVIEEGKALRFLADIPNSTIKAEVHVILEEKRDSFLIKGFIKNEGSEPVNAGIRFLIDTWAGDTDGVPFILPAAKDNNAVYTQEVKFNALHSSVWETWNPERNTVAFIRNELTGEGLTAPDEVALVNWGQAYHSEWDYQVSESMNVTGDSAVILWWQPEQLLPGKTREIATRFGSYKRTSDINYEISEDSAGNGYLKVMHHNETDKKEKVDLRLKDGTAKVISPADKRFSFEVEPRETFYRSIPVTVAATDSAGFTVEKFVNNKPVQDKKITVSQKHEQHAVMPDTGEAGKKYPVQFISTNNGLKPKAILKRTDNFRKLAEADLLPTQAGNVTIYSAEILLPEDYEGDVIVEIIDM